MTTIYDHARHARMSVINNSFEQFKKELTLAQDANMLNDVIPWKHEAAHEQRTLVDWLLHESAKYQRFECVEYLIPLSDPKSFNSRAFQFALSQNNQPLIDLLLPHSDIDCAESLLLQMAMFYDNQYMLHTYIDQCDTPTACQGLINRGFADLAEQLEQFAAARATKHALTTQISIVNKTKPIKKI